MKKIRNFSVIIFISILSLYYLYFYYLANQGYTIDEIAEQYNNLLMHSLFVVGFCCLITSIIFELIIFMKKLKQKIFR
jgi:hypothetical protein